MKTIVLTGGGSGGHITPILSVADELKAQAPDCKLIYIGQKGDQLADIPAQHPSIDEVRAIHAGKFRRYHGEGIKQLFDVVTLAKNIRDIFRILIGMVESYRLLGKLKPDVVFIKGGFVGVPVGKAAHWRKIPYITHDSDAIPGLANRLIAKYAAWHATGMPAELYSYPKDKTVYVGVPISRDFTLVSEADQVAAKQKLNITPEAPLLFITGGGLGAARVNTAVQDNLQHLFKEVPNLMICITAGRGKVEAFSAAVAKLLSAEQARQVIVKDYVTDLHVYSAAADVVVARAGATNLAELATQGKACIIIPNPQLTGGHQIKNAQSLATAGAVMVLPESYMTDGVTLRQHIVKLLSNKQQRQEMGQKFHSFAMHNAAKELAALLLKV